jgi:hypothetical protein
MPAITDRTRKMLWGRSGGVCAICKKQLIEDVELSDNPSVLGQECHIVGEENAAKSPRGLNPMPLDQRNLFDNLILLCRDHHKIIDDQPDKYTIEEIHRIKNEHIIWVRQTLGFDEAKQLDDETYMAIAQKWAELAGLDDWDNFTYLVIARDSPTVKAERLRQLEDLHDLLFKQVYPDRYLELNNAFENFRRVLHDFRSVFSDHIAPPKDGEKYVRTRKFYKSDERNEELYAKLGKEYEEHRNLLSDYAVELTRASNYICDLMRKHIYRGFRIKEGLLVAQTGTWMDGVDRTVRVAYKPEERTGFPYPGRNKFMTVRCERDFYYGPAKD